MKIYEVKKSIATFGIGMVLELTKEQAETRSDSITKKGDHYVVNSPITFKCGEKVAVVSGEVSKSLVDGLKELDSKEPNGDESNKNQDEKKDRKDINNDDNEKDDANSDDEENKDNENTAFPSMKHMGFGNYDVFNSNGEKITEKPIKKAEAEKLLEELKAEAEDDV